MWVSFWKGKTLIKGVNCPTTVNWTSRKKKKTMNIFYMQLSWSDCMLSHFSHVQLFVTPADCSPPGSFVHGILQARILEQVATPSSRGSSWPRDQTCVSYACGSSASVRVKHEDGAAAWLVGILEVPSVKGHALPLLQELWPYQSLCLFLSIL